MAALAIGWKATAGCSGVTIHQNFTKSVCALISRSIKARAAAIVSIFTIGGSLYGSRMLRSTLEISGPATITRGLTGVCCACVRTS